MRLVNKSFLFTLAMCAMVLLASKTRADVLWDVDTGAYGDAANWDTGIVPTTDDRMFITNGGTATISTPQALDMANFRFYGNSTLIVEPGGELGSTGWSFLGKSGSAGDTATMTMNGGLVKIDRTPINDGNTSSFIVGRESHGILNMNGGLLEIQDSFKIDDKVMDGGEVYLNGGKITASAFDMDAAGNSASMDITGGVLEISANIEAYIDAQIGTGLLTGFGGAGTVMRNYDATSGITRVWAEVASSFSPADFNEDTFVDGVDLTTWSDGYGLNANGDANGNGLTDGTDLLVWQQEFAPGTSTLLAVPEPSSLVLLLLFPACCLLRTN